jgi:cell division protein FtsB
MSQGHKILLAVVFFAMFNLLIVILFGDNGLVELGRLRQTHQRLMDDNKALALENQKMYRSIDRLQSDSEFVENIARRELGMIRSNELIFKFKSGLTPP